jgi:hypothetical protein
MKTRYKIAFAAAAALIAGGSHAAAYKCQDEKGRTVYSDIPCMKKEAPKTDPAPAKAAAPTPVAAAPITRITEADVLRTLTATQDYVRTNDHTSLCALYAADMKFRLELQGDKGKVTSGGREEACINARNSADLSKRANLIQQTERGATKVTIEPGEMKAVAVYESVNRLTRYDRIVSSFRCNSQDHFVLTDGKLLITSSSDVCK